jgi:peptidoglycan/LPS O-acetylase OafA/YrhL
MSSMSDKRRVHPLTVVMSGALLAVLGFVLTDVVAPPSPWVAALIAGVTAVLVLVAALAVQRRVELRRSRR